MGKKRQDADRLGVIGIAQDLLARFCLFLNDFVIRP